MYIILAFSPLVRSEILFCESMHTSTWLIYLKATWCSIMRYTLYKDTFNITQLVTIIPEDLEAAGLILMKSVNQRS